MTRLSLISSLLTVLFIFSAESSFARGGGEKSGFFFDETFMPVMTSTTDNESFDPAGTPVQVAADNGIGFDFRTTVGYTFPFQMILGLTYNTYSFTTTRSAVNGGSEGMNEKKIKNEYGPSLGYNFGNWRVMFTYFLSATKQLDRKYTDSSGAETGNVTIKNSDGSGFQLAVGYSYNLGSHFEIGPSLVYRAVSYSKQSKTNAFSAAETFDSTALPSKEVDNNLTPMITMQAQF